MEVAGCDCIGFCEIDKFARESYKAIYNTEGEVELYDITRALDEFIQVIGSMDVICGGRRNRKKVKLFMRARKKPIEVIPFSSNV